jgi:hypothetical protein
MTVRIAEISMFDSLTKVGDLISAILHWSFAFVLFLERRDKHNDLRYDDCSFDCEGGGETGDVGDQRFVSPDSIPLLINRHRVLLAT